jgi:hypothetical protein
VNGEEDDDVDDEKEEKEEEEEEKEEALKKIVLYLKNPFDCFNMLYRNKIFGAHIHVIHYSSISFLILLSLMKRCAPNCRYSF